MVRLPVLQTLIFTNLGTRCLHSKPRTTRVKGVVCATVIRNLTSSKTDFNIANDSCHEVNGFTRRSVKNLAKKVGWTPEFPSLNKMRINVPGLPMGTFDTHGQRQLVCYLGKLVYLTTLNWPFPTNDPDEKHLFYILAFEISIQPSIYDDNKKGPFVIDSSVNYVKRSSRCFQIDISESEQMYLVVTSSYIEVNVDPVTRRPKQFPQLWKDENRFPEDGPQPKVEDIKKPTEGTLVTERKIHFTDTDEYNHANSSTYMRMCLDSFYENILKSKYSQNSSVYLKGWIKNAKLTFKGEASLGDILTIESWEDRYSPDTFYFEIGKAQEVVATVSITFYRSLMTDR